MMLRFVTPILIVCFARAVLAAEPKTEGELNLFVQQNAAPKTKSLDQRIAIPVEWARLSHTFTAAADYEAGETSVGFHVGFGPQVVEIADLTIEAADQTPLQQIGSDLSIANNDAGAKVEANQVDVESSAGVRALRLTSTTLPSDFWRSLVAAPINVPLAKGQTYRISFRARTLEATPQPYPGRTRIVGGHFYADLDATIPNLAPPEQIRYQSFMYGSFSVQITSLAPGRHKLVVQNARTWFGDNTVRTFDVRVDGASVGKVRLDTTQQTFERQDEVFEIVATGKPLTVSFDGGRLSVLRVVDEAGNVLAEAAATSRMPPGYLAKQNFFFDPATVAPGEAAPPWPPQYKIRPDEVDRLTAADVVGPDGIVYPDFRYAGVRSRAADLPIIQSKDHGATPNDDADDSDAIRRAAIAAGEAGGGVVQLEAGVYQLDKPVRITHDRVIIRGEGKDQTRLVFRFAPKVGELTFADPPSDKLHPADIVELFVQHENISRLKVIANDRVVRDGALSMGDGGRFNVVYRCYELVEKGAPPGRVRVVAEAEWKDGRTARAEQTVDVSPAHPRHARFPATAAIQFNGRPDGGGKLQLTQPGFRGSSQMHLAATTGLAPGDVVLVHTPTTPNFLERLRTKCPYLPRRALMVIKSVEPNVVTFTQPLRTDWSVEDGTTVTKVVPIRQGGVESLSIEQTNPLWTNLIGMEYAIDCHVQDVRLTKAGRHPVLMDNTKHCEVIASEFNDAWFKGGGGTAYAGFFSFNWDCLMRDVRTTRLRHGPCIQWASSGNVIRDSTFIDSDLQFHAGWAFENLIENCVVDARGKQSYGWAVYASVPEADIHGPSGPRNVIRNNDITAVNGALMMGGLNENWIITHNRFDIQRYTAMAAKDASFDHIIRGNVFILRNKLGETPRPLILLASKDCVGIELIDNTFVVAGNPPLVGGPGELAMDRENRVVDLRETPPRPVPTIPSLHDWQRTHHPLEQ